MARPFKDVRKSTNKLVYDFSQCQFNYLRQKSILESKRKGRVISMSRIIANIVSEKMKDEKYSCS